MLNFYNQNGKPIVYTDDNIHLFSFSGKPVAYIYGELVYTFAGKHIGFFIDGWIRDLNGYCVFFSENATGGMLKPLKQLLPIKSPKHLLTVKSIRQFPNLTPVKRTAWSRYSDLDFFS